MKLTKLQIFSMALSVASLVIGFIQNQVDGKLTEDFVRDEVNRILEDKGK